MSLVCLAGNHSCWAAKRIVEKGHHKPELVKYRCSWVFCEAELPSDLKFILSGAMHINIYVHQPFLLWHVYLCSIMFQFGKYSLVAFAAAENWNEQLHTALEGTKEYSLYS